MRGAAPRACTIARSPRRLATISGVLAPIRGCTSSGSSLFAHKNSRTPNIYLGWQNIDFGSKLVFHDFFSKNQSGEGATICEPTGLLSVDVDGQEERALDVPHRAVPAWPKSVGLRQLLIFSQNLDFGGNFFPRFLLARLLDEKSQGAN